jgi:hypothetical protein
MEEMHALKENGTWEIVKLKKGQKTIGRKWVFAVKCKADASVERLKARLVAKDLPKHMVLIIRRPLP